MQSVHVSELVPATVTRARGDEAFQRLEEILALGPIELVLDGAYSMSGSFLDEVIRRLELGNKTEFVTFVTTDRRAIQKLGRIAGIRGARVFAARRSGGPRKEVSPTPFRQEQVKFRTRKSGS